MGLFDKLFGGNKKQESAEPEEPKLKISASGMPFMEMPERKGPWSVEDHITEAVNLFVGRELKRALEHINKAIAMDHENSDAYSVRASIKRDMGDTKGADLDQEKSEDLAPEKSKDDDGFY
jgi:hypothetical protein